VSEGPGQAVSVLLRAMLDALGPGPGDLDEPSEDAARWFDSHREQILAVAQEAVAHGDPRTAASFLVAAWSLVPPETDAYWCDSLRECGRSLSEVLPASPVLAGVYRRTAEVYFARGDHRIAEAEGLRELAVWRRLDDPDEHVEALAALARTFLARDRLHRAIDCADERLSVHLRHQRHDAVAEDLQRLGALMIRAGRADTAVDYLTRARDAFDDLPDAPAGRQAEVRVLLGRALWLTGAEALARRQFSRALQLLVDVDHDAAERVRELLAIPPGEKLPEVSPAAD
jgi:tetratricopeptide (TPR) repeat protein